jgi:hypothetical protein
MANVAPVIKPAPSLTKGCTTRAISRGHCIDGGSLGGGGLKRERPSKSKDAGPSLQRSLSGQLGPAPRVALTSSSIAIHGQVLATQQRRVRRELDA